MAIPAAFFAALAEIPAIAAATEETLNLVSSLSQGRQVNRIEAQTTATLFALQSPFTGLPALLATLQDIQRALVNLGAPQQAGRPVTLPVNPPAAYGGASASDVWSYLLSSDPPFTAGDWANLAYSREFEANQAGLGEWSGYYPGYRVGIALGGGSADIPNGPTNYPLDFSTILPTDASILAWVQRVYPATAWRTGAAGAVFEMDSGNSGVFWYIGITQAQFLILQRTGPGGALEPGDVPPVWPGLSKVTLGTPVAITAAMSGLTIPGPLDGLITAIASVPVPIGYYSFDGDKSFVHLGGVAFQNDNGDDEAAQPMTFQAQVIVPRSMVRASSAKVRVQSGTTGTVTPWTIT